MPMMCYTRNFEDVILQRVLGDVAKGHFIDVGASKPVEDSNTYAFYQRGWRGVAIEPLGYQELWRQFRPEDVFVNAVAGSQPGHMTFQVYDQLEQISSGSTETHVHWERRGVQPTRSIDVPLLTLNQVISEHLASKPLHLISIDVEGMEHEVLKGLNLEKHRPWLVIVEATLPGWPAPTHQDWEPYLLSASYLMAYFDGVNRFYLAQEHGHLIDRFTLPPNVWDEFVMAREQELKAQVTQLKAQIAALQTERTLNSMLGNILRVFGRRKRG
jgi:FkbM family methyltransferase